MLYHKSIFQPFQNIFESIHLERLFVGVVTNESMMKSLQLSWPELINLSIIQGNDFTSPIIRKYSRLWRDNVRIPKSDPTKPYALIKDVANYVRRLDSSIIQECSELFDFCVSAVCAFLIESHLNNRIFIFAANCPRIRSCH